MVGEIPTAPLYWRSLVLVHPLNGILKIVWERLLITCFEKSVGNRYMNEYLLDQDLNKIFHIMIGRLMKKLSISYHEEFQNKSKILSVNHNNLSICRLNIDETYLCDYGNDLTLEKCGELLAGMLLHTLLIRHQTGAKQLGNNND
jgi:hypothetical protein